MKRSTLLIIAVCLFSTQFGCSEPADSPPASAEQPAALTGSSEEVTVADLDELKRLWRDGRYPEVLPALLEYRKTQPYGKNEVVDYMIGTSACRIADKRELGYEFLAWMLQHYPLDASSREKVAGEMETCRTPITESGVTPVLLTNVRFAVSAPGVSGKMFYDVTRGEDLPMSNEPVEVVREIPSDSLAARRYVPAKRTLAAASLQRRLGSEFTTTTTTSFVLGSAAHDENALNAVGDHLQNLLQFYVSEYELTQPEHLITVYLVPSVWQMRELAEEIHGLRLAGHSIGYSMRDDLSMVGVIPGKIYGTLAHELFHLIVRRDFGDIPAWMDEGMAALYEVSGVTEEGVRGLPNWRGPVLQRFWSLRPSIESLVGMDWQSFENSENDFESTQQMANHATARYFVLFLQERGRLVDVFKAFQDRSVTSSASDPADDAARLLASVLGRPLEEVDRDFAAWFDEFDY